RYASSTQPLSIRRCRQVSFRIQKARPQLPITEPGLSPLSAHLLYPFTASCGRQIAVVASDFAAARRWGESIQRPAATSKSLASLLCAYALSVDARASTVGIRFDNPQARVSRVVA